MEALRALLAAAPDAMIVVELDGQIVMANEPADRLFDVAIGELEGQQVEVLVPEAARALHASEREHYGTDLASRAMGAGRWVEGRRRDGSTFPAEISLRATEIEGRPLVVAAIRSVVGRARAEVKFQALLEAAPDAMIGVDEDGRIVFANGQSERLFGYGHDDLLGQLIEVLVPEDVRAAHPADRARYIAHPTTRPMGAGIELEGRRSDGSTFPAEISLSAIETGQGVLVTAAIRDVTDRHEAEAALRAARDEAERANQAKSAFLSRMSHELRTPLNSILGFGQLLKINDPSPRQAQHVDFILTSGRHLLELIDEVLDISRIEAGRMALAVEPVLLAAGVAEAVDILRPLAEQRSVIVRTDPDADPTVRVLADRQRLRQVVLNLVANAIKYNRAGGTVDITWRVDGQVVRTSVNDSGIGIRDEAQDRLFLPFERLGDDLAVEGTGLGLALSRNLVVSMGGAMGAESTYGTGSTFWFDLSEGGPSDGPDRDDPAETPAPRPARVLHVEDDLSNLRLIEEILNDRGGVEVVPTRQGELAVDLARRYGPDVILLDLHLPDIDGEQVLDRLKSDPTTRSIPVIVVSADATPGRHRSLLELGAFAFVTKPIDVVRFLEVLDDAFEAAVPMPLA